MNFLSNAIKFSFPKSEIRVHAMIKKKSIEEVTVTLSVVDNGIGISQDDMSHLFEA